MNEQKKRIVRSSTRVFLDAMVTDERPKRGKDRCKAAEMKKSPKGTERYGATGAES